MSETPAQAEDNVFVHSNSSPDANSTPGLKEKLDYLINQESKHSHNYYDLQTRDNFTRLDLENLQNSCQRYEEQKKKKCEELEECYEKLAQNKKNNSIFLKDQLAVVTQQLEQVNALFYKAYDDYNSDSLTDAINFLEYEVKQMEEKSLILTKDLNVKQCKINECLMKPRSSLNSAMDYTIEFLSQSSMKRPEIELEEIYGRLNLTISNILKQIDELKFKTT